MPVRIAAFGVQPSSRRSRVRYARRKAMPRSPSPRATASPPIVSMEPNTSRFKSASTGRPSAKIFVMLLLKNRESRDFIDKYWLEAFPDENSRPARHALQTELGGGAQMQALITAVIE